MASVFEYKVHPGVVLNVIDHYTRRSKGQARVIGTLMGVVREETRVVEIRNCFPVKHIETEDEVGVDLEFQQSMLELHRKVHPNDSIVGWYSTSAELTENDFLLHEIFDNKIKSNGVLVLVDTSNPSATQKLKAFKSTSLKLSNGLKTPLVLGSKLEKAKITYVTSAYEKIALNYFNQQHSLNEKNDIQQLEQSLSKFMQVIEDIQAHLTKVNNGEAKADKQIGKLIYQALDSLATAQISPAQMEKVFNDNLQDLLMVLYLTNLVGSQLSISEKLHNMAVQQ